MLVDDVTYLGDGWHQVLRTADPTTPRIVRKAVGRVLSSWGYRDGELDDATTVAAELIGNAIQHGKSETVELRIRLEQGHAVIYVKDDNPQIPVERVSIEDLALSGRGLKIVGILSESWGAIREGCGKRVFAVMPEPARELS